MIGVVSDCNAHQDCLVIYRGRKKAVQGNKPASNAQDTLACLKMLHAVNGSLYSGRRMS